MKRLGREDDQLPPSSAYGKNAWRYNSMSSYAIMACTGQLYLLLKRRDIIYLVLIKQQVTQTRGIFQIYEGHLESKERFAIQRYLLIIGKKQNMQVL